MKKLHLFIQLVIISIFLGGCNFSERDWQTAKVANSKIEYQKFLKKHPNSEYSNNAKIALDSLEFIDALRTESADSLELYVNNHPQSEFLTKYPEIVDSIDWNIAIFSLDIKKYRLYTFRHPKPQEIQVKLDNIWWNKRLASWDFIFDSSRQRSIIIHSNGKQSIAGETMVGFYTDEETGKGTMGPIPMGAKIEIWRNFTEKEKIKYSKFGVVPGIAYLRLGDRFEPLKEIDLKKSNIEFCKEFKIAPYNN